MLHLSDVFSGHLDQPAVNTLVTGLTYAATYRPEVTKINIYTRQ